MSFIDKDRLQAAIDKHLDSAGQLSVMKTIREHFEEFENTITMFSAIPKARLKDSGAYIFLCEELLNKGIEITPSNLKIYMSIIRNERGISKQKKRTVTQKTVPVKSPIAQNNNQPVKNAVPVVVAEPVKTFDNTKMTVSSTLNVFPEWLPLGINLQNKSINDIIEPWHKKNWESKTVKGRMELNPNTAPEIKEIIRVNISEGLEVNPIIEQILSVQLGLITVNQKLADFLLYLEYKVPGILTVEEPWKNEQIKQYLVENNIKSAKIIVDGKSFDIMPIYRRYIQHLESIKRSVDSNKYIPSDRGENIWTDGKE